MSIYDPKKPSKINSFSVTLTLVTFVFGYAGTFYLPTWFAVWRYTGVMTSVANEGYRVFDHDQLMTKLMQGAARLDLPLTKDNLKIDRTPLEAKEITPEMPSYVVQRGKRVKISLDVKIPVTYPLTEKVKELHFKRQMEVDMQAITW